MPNRIKELRIAKGLSQDALAELANTSQPQIDRLEKGQRNLTQTWMTRIAKALGVRPAELLPESRGITPDQLDEIARALKDAMAEEGVTLREAQQTELIAAFLRKLRRSS